MIPIETLPDVAVLNCGAGDMRFSFDPSDPQEAARAERVVVDMLARGYLLFADLDGRLQRVTGFDPATHEYIVADGPGPASPAAVVPPVVVPEPAPEPKVDRPINPKTGRPDGRCGRKGRRVKAHGTKVTSVAPTSGG